MSKTPPGTVKETGARSGQLLTGARSGQLLIGIEEQPLNRELRIKIHRPQAPREGGRVKGSFELVAEGTGTYAPYLKPYVGESFMRAAELIAQVRAHGGKALDCTHVLNCNNLRVDSNQP